MNYDPLAEAVIVLAVAVGFIIGYCVGDDRIVKYRWKKMMEQRSKPEPIKENQYDWYKR